MDAVQKIGTLQDTDQGRDAIHVPIITMQAKEDLHLGLDMKYGVTKEGDIVMCENPRTIGILDPYLPHSKIIRKGQWFYVFLRPGSITSLAHVWTHPALPSSVPSTAEPVREQTSPEDRILEFLNNLQVEITLEEFCDILLDRGDMDKFKMFDDYIIVQGQSIFAEIPHRIINDVESYLGQKVKNRPLYFSCSC